MADQRVENPDGWSNANELSQAMGTLRSHGLIGAAEYSNCVTTVAHVAASGQKNNAYTKQVCVLPDCGASFDAPSNCTSDGWLAFNARLSVLPDARTDPVIVSIVTGLPSRS